jgi:type VI secretion system protein ImpH
MKRTPFASRLREPTLSAETVECLYEQPWRYGFLPLMRRIGADDRIDPIGTARRPGAEPFRLGQKPSLAFAPRELASVAEVDGRLNVRLFGLGMLGPNGPLPIHVTEIAREREENRHDHTLVDFLDIFHHRYFTLLYRAWADAQATVGLDRAGAGGERFSFYIASLSGDDSAEIARRVLPAHARLAASAHLVREARDPDGLRSTLERFFGVPVAIDEYVFHWIDIAHADQCRLGRRGDVATMGRGAMLGEQVPDRQHRFRVVIGPLDLDEYLRFTPRGVDLPKLVDWVRVFVGREFEWEVELRIRAQSAPPAQIGGPQQLGWTGWLGCSSSGESITGMRFEPERYADQFVNTCGERRVQPDVQGQYEQR